MKFVYLLAHNGTPFYVGITKSLTKRYIHHYKVRDCNSFDYLHYILNTFNEYVDIIPLYYCDNNKAAILETETIKKLCDNNIALCNRLNNKRDNRIIVDCNRNKQRFPKSLKIKLTTLESHLKISYGQ